jgi:putative acetyltransferase
MPGMSLREERDGDVLEVRHLLQRAFERDTEAEMVDRLRGHGSKRLALVAEQHGQVVGYCLWTPAVIDSPVGRIAGMALAPLAVMPKLQGKGTGTALIERALVRLRQDRCPYALALGAPGYYARFGFRPARFYEVHCESPAMPDDAFMILAMDARRLMGVSGPVRLPSELTMGLFQ